MHYQTVPPPESLHRQVHYFWVLEGDGPAAFTTLADGCPGILWHRPGGAPLTAGGDAMPALSLYGQTTRPLPMATGGPFRIIGCYLFPHALRSLFGLNATALTDACTDLRNLTHSAHFLTERMLYASGAGPQVRLLADWLQEMLLAHKRAGGNVIPYALHRMEASGGSVPMQTLLQELHLTERSFQRQFKESVGIGPKLFARICRFQSGLHLLRHDRFGKLSDIAFDQSYADQSHYIREFRAFAGCTPFQYRTRLTEVVPNFPVVED